MSSREEILRAVRSARSGEALELASPEAPAEAAGYRRQLQADPVGVFVRRAEELGVRVHRLEDPRELAAAVAQLCDGRRTYVEPALRDLGVSLRKLGLPLVDWDRLSEAEVGVTGADYGIAESATLVLVARPNRPRSASLLPPVHVAVLREDRVLADLFDLLERLGGLPSALVLASGPSRSADIEMSLAVGVHGPGIVHVVLLPPDGQEGRAESAK
ncbi:MAG: lactate utilization protein [Armatimonadota bacterium]|nr:lactate utilization protein [Armatimonadota bacterium]MDR7413862.1 lactate utilization protein [Armatimonadota bacterium]MDR7428915.1 lactate utilization protein [Armatimonadota bacterium]MDR7460945.1 lactate utilization protein [Armatimonadota bacterium]MDR7616792.1 lactate utilization protein [Armatimonadota bacterium]